MLLTLDDLLILVPIMVLGALSPGPDVLFILSRVSRESWKPGFVAVGGIATGLLVHGTLASFGCAELIAKYPSALSILQYIGGAYLLYLAYGTLQSLRETGEVDQARSKALGKQESYKKIFTKGIFNNLLNPKTVLFFVAILPQFITPERGQYTQQLTQLAILAIGTGVLCHIGVALTGHAASRFTKPNPKRTRIQKLLLSGLFGLLALKLLLGF